MNSCEKWVLNDRLVLTPRPIQLKPRGQSSRTNPGLGIQKCLLPQGYKLTIVFQALSLLIVWFLLSYYLVHGDESL